MTIYSPTSKAKYVGNGTTTAFSVPFYFFDNLDSTNQLAVYITPVGALTSVLKTEGVDYTVTGADNPSGGFVNFVTAPALNEKIAIIRNVPVTQEVGFVEGEDFPAEDYEFSLDKITMEIQQIEETLSRALIVDVSSEASIPEIIEDVQKVAADLPNIDAVAGDLPNIDAVAGDLTNIDTVAGISDEVYQCGTHVTEIITLYDDLKTGGTGYIQTCVANLTNINKVGNSIINVNRVGDSIGNVNAVANNRTNINTVATNIADVNTCASNITAIQQAPTYAAEAKQWAIGEPTEPAGNSAKWWAKHAGIFPKGEYSVSVVYGKNDLVYVDNTAAHTRTFYISLQDTNSGHAVTDTAWWQEMWTISTGGSGEPDYFSVVDGKLCMNYEI